MRVGILLHYTSAEFAGYPVNIFLRVEDYLKKKKNAHTETWIMTIDLTLDFAANPAL